MAAYRSSIVWGGIGAALLVLAPIVSFVLTPQLTKLPGDSDVKFGYSGKATLLNGAALRKGDAAHVFEANVPVTLDREIKVTSTSGDSAMVKDASTMHAGGAAIPSINVYDIDRTTMRTVAGGKGIQQPPGCLAVALPLHPEASNAYRLYDAPTQRCYPVRYVDRTSVSGRSVYRYTVSAAGPLKDANTLASLPPSLPKATLASLASTLPAALRQKLAPAIATLPDPVPLTYLANTQITVWADTQTGVAIDEAVSQKVIVALPVLGKTVPVVPVLMVDVKMTAASIRFLANKASSAGLLLTLFETIIPIGLAVIGTGLLAWAFLRYRRKVRTAQAGHTRASVPERTPAASL